MVFVKERCDLIGAWVAMAAFVLTSVVFAARVADRPGVERGAGILIVALLVPLAYLLLSAPSLGRPRIYVLWVGLMMVFLIAELLLDYVFAVPFREVPWQAIAYVMLFFAALGGMLGLAGQAGRAWLTAAVVGFLVTGTLAFWQHGVTGR